MLLVYILPLIHILKDLDKLVQVSCVDATSACTKLETLCDWSDLLMRKDVVYGYFPEAEKSYLLVNEKDITYAQGHI